MKFLSLSVLASLASLIGASTFSPARPPSYPLAVKSPYLSTWLPAGSADTNGGQLAGKWPEHWARTIKAWVGMVRVDGQTFSWLGNATNAPVANQVSASYTSTKSIFVFDVNGVELTATFLSPVFPDDLKRQSLVFSYLDVAVKSADGGAHDVQIYTDVSAEWASGDSGNLVQWESATQGNVKFHRFYRQTQQEFSEINDCAEWGTWLYGTSQVDGLSFQSGADDDVRGAFQNSGNLANTDDTAYRAIRDRWPVFGFARNVGSVNGDVVNTQFSIGLAQQYSHQFANSAGYNRVPSLWTSYYGSDAEALEGFHSDFASALEYSNTWDDRISDESIAAAGQNYLTITSLAFRQAFAGTQLAGTPDHHYLFMKEISSNGNFQTVDVFFPMHPILLYTNPELLKLIMDPHFENQEAGLYPNKWSIHDLGAHYPNATGHPAGDDEPMPLEECGNMLIMVLAYYQRSNNLDYLNAHWPLLDQWAQYLIEDSLYPADQLSTDDFAGRLNNQTNLGLKGMIGLAAASQVANLTGHSTQAKNYSDIAFDYINQWVNLGNNKAADPPHSILNYNNPDTWGILYNLYADRELGTNLVPQQIYDQQSTYYPTVANAYGVPLDTRGSYTKSDWEMFAAAIASESTRDLMIGDLAKWIGSTGADRPMSDIFETVSGDMVGGIQFTARPVIGGVFALLALAK